MATQAQILTILNILVALHLSRVLYKSTLFLQNKPNLLNTQMNVSSVLTVDYENKSNWNLAKTNPIQTQYKANTNPIPEMSKMNVTSILTKDYENKPPSSPKKTNPIQTQSNPISTECTNNPDINPKHRLRIKKDLDLSPGLNSGGIIWGPEDAIYLDINFSICLNDCRCCRYPKELHFRKSLLYKDLVLVGHPNSDMLNFRCYHQTIRPKGSIP